MLPSQVKRFSLALFCTGAILSSGCATTSENDSLYLALGGHDGIAKITQLFVMEIAYDDRVFHHFADSNVERFAEKFAEHLCTVVDGPCQYTGDSMIDIHTGMDVTEGGFNAIVEDLMNAMNQADISIGVQNRVLARLAKFRGEVINL
ncbi:MAG: group 1 truncated hemoglobin [Pseudohongiellaceae bacterium]|nr:group 1 truncated hemoglobin [Pseudohongiellaceae bacterium]